MVEYVPPKEVDELPIEVLHHCLTFLPTNEVMVTDPVNKKWKARTEDDDLWELLLERDKGRRKDSLPDEMQDRRMREVYQMIHTEKFVERRFEDRPRWQQGLIVVGSIILSPILLIYLSPQICKGIYYGAFRPMAKTWSDMIDDMAGAKQVFDPKLHSWTSQRGGDSAYDPTIPFRKRAWWQKAIIVLLSVPFSPVMIIRHLPSLIKILYLRIQRRQHRMRKFLVAMAKWMYWAGLVPLRQRVADGVKFVHTKALLPIYHHVVLPVSRSVVSVCQYTQKLLTRTVVSCYNSLCWGARKGEALFMRFVVRPVYNAAVWTKDRFIQCVIASCNGLCWLCKKTVEYFIRFVVTPIHKTIVWLANISVQFAIWFYANIMTPLGHACVAVKNWLVNGIVKTVNAILHGIQVTADFIYQHILVPTARAVIWTKSRIVKVITVTATLIYDVLKYCVLKLMTCGNWSYGKWLFCQEKITNTIAFIIQKVWSAIASFIDSALDVACKVLVKLSDLVVLVAVKSWSYIYKALLELYKAGTATLKLIGRGLKWLTTKVVLLVIHIINFLHLVITKTIELILVIVRTIIRITKIASKFFYDYLLAPIGKAIRFVVLNVWNGLTYLISRAYIALHFACMYTYYNFLLPIYQGIVATIKFVAQLAKVIFLYGVYWIVTSIEFIGKVLRLTANFFWDRVLRPVGRGILYAFAMMRKAIKALLHGIYVACKAVYQHVFVPIGKTVQALVKAFVAFCRVMVNFIQNQIVLPLYRSLRDGLRFAYSQMLMPVLRAIQNVLKSIQRGIAQLLRILLEGLLSIKIGIMDFFRSFRRKKKTQ